MGTLGKNWGRTREGKALALLEFLSIADIQATSMAVSVLVPYPENNYLMPYAESISPNHVINHIFVYHYSTGRGAINTVFQGMRDGVIELLASVFFVNLAPRYCASLVM